MPYILNKTNGTVVAIVQDASIDQTTDLTFLGRNYAGYGEIQNENFLKLLENFSNTTPPPNKIEGQLWYDSVNKRLNVYNNSNWKSIANLEVSASEPSTAIGPVVGDLWYDTVNNQLKVWNNAEYILIGPPTGSDVQAQWRGDFEYEDQSFLPVFNIKAVIGSNDQVVAIVSGESYDMPDPGLITTSPAYPTRTPEFTHISKGITLVGADPVTGSSVDEGIYFWGSARHAVHATSADTASASSGISATFTNTNQQFFVPFINTVTNLAHIDAGLKYNPSENVLYTIASQAYYADLAERYASDAIYEPGTVVVLGGEKEVTTTDVRADVAVAGVISTNPAYMMNSDAGNNDTHPYVALAGRVKCKVHGPVRKGQLLVSSNHAGHAEAALPDDHPAAIIGKSLEDFHGQFGVIEIKV